MSTIRFCFFYTMFCFMKYPCKIKKTLKLTLDQHGELFEHWTTMIDRLSFKQKWRQHLSSYAVDVTDELINNWQWEHLPKIVATAILALPNSHFLCDWQGQKRHQLRHKGTSFSLAIKQVWRQFDWHEWHLAGGDIFVWSASLFVFFSHEFKPKYTTKMWWVLA